MRLKVVLVRYLLLVAILLAPAMAHGRGGGKLIGRSAGELRAGGSQMSGELQAGGSYEFVRHHDAVAAKGALKAAERGVPFVLAVAQAHAADSVVQSQTLPAGKAGVAPAHAADSVVQSQTLPADQARIAPAHTADSVRLAPRLPAVPMIYSRGSVMLPLRLEMEGDDCETPEMRAARINRQARESVMSYIGNRFEYEKMPDLPLYVLIPMSLSGLFLWNDAWGAIGGYKVSYQRHGYVPLSMTTPFISAWLPGWAPYENLSGEDFFPKAVETEFDITTGTFRQVNVDWNEYQKKLDMTRMRYNSSTSVPFMPLNSVERKVFGNKPVMP